MQVEERVAKVVNTPLEHLERMFTELSQAMSKAADFYEGEISDLDGDERFAKIIMMVHSRGIATGMKTAASELAKARAVVLEVVDERRAES